jgi:hypothetical protein
VGGGGPWRLRGQRRVRGGRAGRDAGSVVDPDCRPERRQHRGFILNWR